MAFVKPACFNKELKANAALFKALSHPARLVILKYMAESNICIGGNDSDKIHLSPTTVNQHLKKLKKAGLIQETKEGVKGNYSLNSKKIKTLLKDANDFFASSDIDFKNLCE